GQRGVAGFDEHVPSEIDCRRPPVAGVERLRSIEGVEVFIDVQVTMLDRQSSQQPERSPRILAPVRSIHDDHYNATRRAAAANAIASSRSQGATSSATDGERSDNRSEALHDSICCQAKNAHPSVNTRNVHPPPSSKRPATVRILGGQTPS